MIRLATMHDIGKLTEMGHRFADEVLDDLLPFNEEAFGNMCKTFINNPNMIIIVSDDDGIIKGSIAGILSPWIMDYGIMMLTEQWWWVDPEWRGESHAMDMLESLVAWGKIFGANRLMMVAIGSNKEETVKKYYKIKGFKYVEAHFLKEI